MEGMRQAAGGFDKLSLNGNGGSRTALRHYVIPLDDGFVGESGKAGFELAALDSGPSFMMMGNDR
jgi:hypothetical protein